MNSLATTTEPASAPPTASEMERAFAELELRNLPPISRVMGVFFAVVGALYWLAFPATGGTLLLGLWLGMAALFFGIAEIARRRQFTTHQIIWLSGLASLAATIGALVSMYVIAQPVQVVGACLLVLGLGLLVVTLRWYLLTLNITVIAWLLLVWRQGATPEWLATLILFGGAVAFSVCIHILRERVFIDLERTRLRQERQQEQLERSLREQERIQNELRETETRYRTLVEQLPAATYIDALDPSSTSLYISPQIQSISGYTAAEWMAEGGMWEKLLHPQDVARVMEALRKHQDTGECFETEYRMVARDGRVVWIHDTAVIVKDGNGAPVYSQGYMTDITGRKEEEAALRRRDAIFETVRYAAETFLRAPSWEDRIGRVLARLGTTTQVNRVYLDETVMGQDETRTVIRRYEWRAPNTDAPIESGAPDAPRERGLGRWETLLSMGMPVYGHSAEFPEEERKVLRAQGIQSIAVIPVFVGRGWWGMIGFEVRREAHTWTTMELDALQAAANTLGAAIQRRADERAVAAARDLALEASRLKSEFLAMMSHEIRTPMNTIVGMSELLLESPLTAEQREYAGSVRYASDVLLTIINDILDFSKIEAGRFTLEPVAFDLQDLIAGTVELLATTAREKGLELRVEIEPDVPHDLFGDAGRLRQVLINLLSNAVKFTERGRVLVRVTLDKTRPDLPLPTFEGARVWVAFSVRDTGIGISPETRARLFQPFMQGDMSITRRYGGTGLGLAISRRLVELMGGEIGVESVEGQGSTFHFSVPLQTQMTPADGQTLSSGEPLTSDRVRGLVLVAEDNPANQKLAQLQLQLLGVRDIELVGTGRAVVNAIRNDTQGGVGYSLVLMDCQMPEMDGLAAARAIRQLERGTGQHIPIVALTASAMQGDREACLAAGMDDCIVKPLRLDALRAALERWLPGGPERVGLVPGAPERRELIPSNSAPMDFKTLRVLRELELAEDGNGTRELAEAYLAETRTRVELLQTALNAEQLAQAAAIAHSIRGSSASLGAQRLSDIASEIEKCAQDNDRAGAIERLPALCQEFERVNAALRAEAFVA